MTILPAGQSVRERAVEACANGIWESLIGVTHDGSEPWDSFAMRRYNGTSMARDNVLRMATAALDAALEVLNEPDEAMWNGLARAIIMWMDMKPTTPRALFKHLEASGIEPPLWLRCEHEMQNLDHVPSKGTRAVLVFRAMLATAKEPAK